MRKKPLKRIRIESNAGQAVQEKGNMDVEIAIDAIDQIDNYDQAVFFTGDFDFLALVSYLRKKGRKIYIISSRRSVSMELRTGADGYIDIAKVPDVWGKRLRYRTQK